jgi:two-component system, LytTR family, response regulator
LLYLLEHPRSTRDKICEALWPDESLEAASNLLGANLTYLRRAVSPVEVKLAGGAYSLEGPVWYDAAEFSSKINPLLNQAGTDTGPLRAALSLYRRDFLDNFYYQWSLERQQQLLQLYLAGLKKLARFHQERRDYREAEVIWQQVIVKDSFDDEAHLAAIRCLLAEGRRAQAGRVFEQYLKTLQELDLTPSPETRRLMEELK